MMEILKYKKFVLKNISNNFWNGDLVIMSADSNLNFLAVDETSYLKKIFWIFDFDTKKMNPNLIKTLS